MHTDSSAIRTCSAFLSAVEKTATVEMPNSRQARIIRIAIVPRFATSSFLNIDQRSALSNHFDDHQGLTVFYRIPVLGENSYHPPRGRRFYFIHHLHRLDYAQRLALAHRRSFLNERRDVR